MKKLLLSLLFLVAINAFAQTPQDSLKWLKDTVEVIQVPIDPSTGLCTFKIIDTIKGTKKNELYSRAKVWATNAFNSVKNVTQLDDPDGGNLILKGVSQQRFTGKYFNISSDYQYTVHFTLRITVKDEKYRVLISDITVNSPPTSFFKGYDFLLESPVLELKNYNQNAKTGNSEFNSRELMSKSEAKKKADYVNGISYFALSTLQGIQKEMLKPAASDDF